MGRMPASWRRCAWTPTSSSQCFRRAAALPAPASRAQVTAAFTPKYARVARSGSGIPSAWRWRSTNIAATVTCGMDLAGGVRLPTKPGHLRRGKGLSSAGQKLAAVVLAADVPLSRPATLQKLVAARQGADVALIGFRASDPTGYGRIVRRSDGTVARVVEEKDASAEERKIAEVNASIYLVDAPFLFAALR